MLYSIRHLTKFAYSVPVTESFLEVRMQPRSEGTQRCLEFELTIRPRAKVESYQDYLGNAVHHFDVATPHTELAVLAESLVELGAPNEIPESQPSDAWNELDFMTARGDFWDFLTESHFVKRTKLLEDLATAFDLRRRDDPLSLLRSLNHRMYSWFDYVPKATRVDSPIDHALTKRAGVCQDFAHILAALIRQLQIPCRYVSGYVYHGQEDHDRSGEGATHAWVEALLPDLGWVGFDPTNDLIAGQRHIRAAVGRDYADVPPTRGVYKGGATSELGVAVYVAPVMNETVPPAPPEMMIIEQSQAIGLAAARYHDQQQQQQ
jgi:transglutaminase-like putative cysteine protease